MFKVWQKRFGMDEDKFTRANLQSFNLKTLRCLVEEMKAEVQRISQHLVHSLVDRDQTAKRNEERLDHVSELLTKYAEANGLKTNLKFYLKFTSYYNDSEYHKWSRSWSIVSQIGRGIISPWRFRVWEGVVMYCTREIDWDRILHHISHEKITSREIKWKNNVEQSLKLLQGSLSADLVTLQRVLISYSRLFPESVFCPEFTTLTAIALSMTQDNEHLSLKVLVTLLEHKLPPQYFANGFQSVKSDILVLTDLIEQFLPNLYSHMEMLRSNTKAYRSYSHENPPAVSESTAFEPPLVDALSLQWLLSCFTICLPRKTVRRVFDSLLIDGSEILLFTALAVWTLMESELLKVQNVADFYSKSSEVVDKLKKGTLISPPDFIQVVYTLKQCAFDENKKYVTKLRKKHSGGKGNEHQLRRSTPICPPPSQGGSLTMDPSSSPPPYLHQLEIETKPITALAECPQTKRSGFVFSYAYAADVPVDLPVKYTMKMSSNCAQLLKTGTIFNIGQYEPPDAVYSFSSN